MSRASDENTGFSKLSYGCRIFGRWFSFAVFPQRVQRCWYDMNRLLLFFSAAHVGFKPQQSDQEEQRAGEPDGQADPDVSACGGKAFITLHLPSVHYIHFSVSFTRASLNTNTCKLENMFTFTFMHLADALIQSDLQLHSCYTFLSVYVFPGNRTHNLLRCWRNALPLSHTGTNMCLLQ